jgi:hypothetical protein
MANTWIAHGSYGRQWRDGVGTKPNLAMCANSAVCLLTPLQCSILCRVSTGPSVVAVFCRVSNRCAAVADSLPCVHLAWSLPCSAPDGHMVEILATATIIFSVVFGHKYICHTIKRVLLQRESTIMHIALFLRILIPSTKERFQ